MQRGSPHPHLALATGLALLVAGCLGAEETLQPQDELIPSRPPALLAVEVVSVAFEPIHNAMVTYTHDHGVEEQRTDATGLVVFPKAPLGRALLEVRAEAFVPRILPITVPNQGELRQIVMMLPIVEGVSYVDVYEFSGFFECSATAFIITGDCMAGVRAVADEAGVELPANATNDQFLFRFPVTPGWSLIRIVQTWDEASAGVGSMMRVNLEPSFLNDTDMHGERFGRADGGSPLVLEVWPETVHETASADNLAPPEDGGLFQTRSFHLGVEELHDVAGAGTLGVGGAIQHEFDVIIEVYYGG